MPRTSTPHLTSAGRQPSRPRPTAQSPASTSTPHLTSSPRLAQRTPCARPTQRTSGRRRPRPTTKMSRPLLPISSICLFSSPSPPAVCCVCICTRAMVRFLHLPPSLHLLRCPAGAARAEMMKELITAGWDARGRARGAPLTGRPLPGRPTITDAGGRCPKIAHAGPLHELRSRSFEVGCKAGKMEGRWCVVAGSQRGRFAGREVVSQVGRVLRVHLYARHGPVKDVQLLPPQKRRKRKRRKTKNGKKGKKKK